MYPRITEEAEVRYRPTEPLAAAGGVGAHGGVLASRAFPTSHPPKRRAHHGLSLCSRASRLANSRLQTSVASMSFPIMAVFHRVHQLQRRLVGNVRLAEQHDGLLSSIASVGTVARAVRPCFPSGMPSDSRILWVPQIATPASSPSTARRRHGRKFTPEEMCQRALRGPIDVGPFVRHVERKHGEIYGV